MYHATDHAYRQTLAIKLGEEQLSPVEHELVAEIGNHVGVAVLNFHCYRTETAANYRQQHVVLVVDSMADKTALEDKLDYAWLQAVFTRYVDDPDRDRRDITKLDVFQKTVTGYAQFVFGYSALEEIEIRNAHTASSAKIVALAKQYEVIWQVSVNEWYHTIFFHSNAQMQACAIDGTHQQIRQDILAILMEHDRFGYAGPHWLQYIRFDTKEVFDAQYQGNWYYYYK